ncbi:MAG: hypothetical protein ABIH39_00510 [Candidatus Margulisiibacteriota bacterium]
MKKKIISANPEIITVNQIPFSLEPVKMSDSIIVIHGSIPDMIKHIFNKYSKWVFNDYIFDIQKREYSVVKKGETISVKCLGYRTPILWSLYNNPYDIVDDSLSVKNRMINYLSGAGTIVAVLFSRSPRQIIISTGVITCLGTIKFFLNHLKESQRSAAIHLFKELFR